MIRILLFAFLLYFLNFSNSSAQSTNARAPMDVIQNGSFELDSDSDAVPDFWHISSPGGRDCVEAHLGACSLMLPGGNLLKAKQKIDFAGTAGDDYSIDFWGKTSGSKIWQAIKVKTKFKCVDGSSYRSTYFFKTRRPTAWEGPLGGGSTVNCNYTKITVWVWYHASAATAWVDDVSLTITASDETGSKAIVHPSPGN